MKPDEIALAQRAASGIASGGAFRVWLDTPGARLALMPVSRAVYLAYTAEGRLSNVGKPARRAGDV